MRTRFVGRPEMVMAYFKGVAGEVRERLAALGARSLSEIVGQVGKLRPRNAEAQRSLGPLIEPLRPTQSKSSNASYDAVSVHGHLIRSMGRLQSVAAAPAILSIANSDRAVGAHLSGQILRRTNFEGLRDEMIDCEFRGAAGQSFGAFLISGLRFRLRGEANDYVGKSLSGGTIAIGAGPDASRRGDVLAGNTILYGATSGELYVAGRAGERFAVRNSGALAVVEGVGQHGCEYMTAGVVIILGPAGHNLGSGMTGGLVYTLRNSLKDGNYNREFILSEAVDAKGEAWLLDDQEEVWLKRVLREHVRLTGSTRAQRLLAIDGPLPLVRLEPIHLPCSIAQTWAPILSRLEQQEITDARLPIPDADSVPTTDAAATKTVQLTLPVGPDDSRSIAKSAC